MAGRKEEEGSDDHGPRKSIHWDTGESELCASMLCNPRRIFDR
jgi:hypothetical protein